MKIYRFNKIVKDANPIFSYFADYFNDLCEMPFPNFYVCELDIQNQRILSKRQRHIVTVIIVLLYFYFSSEMYKSIGGI